jgi:hypothetical protein
MKRLLCILLLSPFFCFSQKDSTKHSVIGWQFVLPFEPGLSCYLSSAINAVPAETKQMFGHNNRIGTQVQVLSAQLHFYDRVYIGVAFDFDGTNFKNNDALAELHDADQDHFVQQEGKYSTSSGFVYGKYSQSYLRSEIGLQLKLKPFIYLQPFISLNYGNAFLPKGRYSFKEYSSNYFYVNEYTFEKPRVKGYSIGLNFVHGMRSGQPNDKKLGFWGVKLDYTFAEVTATGIVSSTDKYRPAAVYSYPVKRKASYLSLAVFIGLSSQKDKR